MPQPRVHQFVIDLVKPDRLTSPLLLPARPPFYADANAWTEAFSVAERAGVLAPFMVSLYRCVWRDDIPQQIRLTLDERLSRARLEIAVQDHEIDTAVRALTEHRVPALLVRGGALCRTVYPEKALRAAVTIEIAVPPNELMNGLFALGRKGYRVEGSSFEQAKRAGGARLSRGAQHPSIHLRTALFQGQSAFSILEFWDRSRGGALPGLPRELRCLSLEDEIALLLRDAVEAGLPVSAALANDIHFAVSRGGSNFGWDRIVATLADLRMTAGAFVVLQVLKRDGVVAVPPAVLIELSDANGVKRAGELRKLAEAAPEIGADSSSMALPRDPRVGMWIAKISAALVRRSAADSSKQI